MKLAIIGRRWSIRYKDEFSSRVGCSELIATLHLYIHTLNIYWALVLWECTLLDTKGTRLKLKNHLSGISLRVITHELALSPRGLARALATLRFCVWNILNIFSHRNNTTKMAPMRDLPVFEESQNASSLAVDSYRVVAFYLFRLGALSALCRKRR